MRFEISYGFLFAIMYLDFSKDTFVGTLFVTNADY